MRARRREAIMTNKTFTTNRLVIIAALLGAVIFGCINIIGAQMLQGVRVDLTQQKLYSLSDGTRAMVGAMAEPIRFRFFMSSGLTREAPQIAAFASRVRAMLDSYVAGSGGKIILEVIDPKPYSEEEDRAVAFGVSPIRSGSGDRLFFGLAATKPSQAPGRYAKWLNEVKAARQGEMNLRTYPDSDAVAQRLIKTNPRLSLDKAQWLAQHWAKKSGNGEWEILGHAAHKVTNANLFRVEEILALYQRITAPVLNVEANDNSMDQWWKGRYTLAEYHERLKSVKNVHSIVIADAGHMMHHDQPAKLAQHIEAFLNQP
jgi:pimeloyl-ACP methyl ester carboxylesterase